MRQIYMRGKEINPLEGPQGLSNTVASGCPNKSQDKYVMAHTIKAAPDHLEKIAGQVGIEPTTFGLTGRSYNLPSSSPENIKNVKIRICAAGRIRTYLLPESSTKI